jgi:hypothetical protein
MTYSSEDLGKPRKRRTSEEATNSSLVGPEDPERGNPPPHTEKDEQSQCKSAISKDPDKDDN